MIETAINNVHNIKFTITSDVELSKEDISFIQSFDGIVFWSNTRHVHWVFDTKMPTGHWLSDIYLNNELTEARAEVYIPEYCKC